MRVILQKLKQMKKNKKIAEKPPTIYKYHRPSPKTGRVCAAALPSVTCRNHSGITVDTWLENTPSGRVGGFSKGFCC